jgi:carbon monoxide dehydrogenase subunit G
MELVNEFTVNRPIEQAWAVLTDVEKIAPCLPGAQLQEIEGDIYRGVVKVKVGPISAALKGEAHFVERDDANHRAVLKGEGRDTKGNGNASALITATLEELSPTSAKCVVHTDLNMTGKVAQFGRGALADISSKLMQQFSKNLDAMLVKDGEAHDAMANDGEQAAAGETAEAPKEAAAAKPAKSGAAKAAGKATAEPATAEPAGAEPATAATAESAAEATAEPAAAEPAPASAKRVINGPAAEPIDAFSLGGSAMLKRLVPLLGGLVILLVALSRRKK